MQDRFLTPHKYLSPEEVAQFRRTLAVEARNALARGILAPPRDEAILETILGAGLRVSEACNLCLGDLFLGYGEQEIIIRDSKRGKSRSVRIGAELKALLKRFLAWKRQHGEPMTPDAPIFLSERKGPYTTRGIQKRFKVYLKKAGISKTCGIHALRHSFALLLYRSSGHNLRAVQQQLGHSSPSTTAIYAHVCDDELRQAVDHLFDATKSEKKPRKVWHLDTAEGEVA